MSPEIQKKISFKEKRKEFENNIFINNEDENNNKESAKEPNLFMDVSPSKKNTILSSQKLPGKSENILEK